MELKHRVYFTVFVVSAAFAAALMSTALVTLPVAWYYPLLHEWRVVKQPGAIAGDWYGRNLVALAAAALAGTVTWLVTRFLPSPATERSFRLLALWTGLLFAFASGLYIYQLSQREAPPEPLPDAYVPR